MNIKEINFQPMLLHLLTFENQKSINSIHLQCRLYCMTQLKKVNFVSRVQIILCATNAIETENNYALWS